MSFYTLRYVGGTDLKDRAHTPCTGEYADFGEADDARQALPNPDLFEVVTRGAER